MKQLFLIIGLITLFFSKTWAQGCAVCTQTANQLDSGSAEGLNNGIVYLALFPLTFIGILGYVWWRYNRGETNS